MPRHRDETFTLTTTFCRLAKTGIKILRGLIFSPRHFSQQSTSPISSELRTVRRHRRNECESSTFRSPTLVLLLPLPLKLNNNMSNHSTEPLILQEMACSYHELCTLISRIPDMQNQPEEIVWKVTDFFRVEPVVADNVIAVNASSHDKRHPLEESLTPSTNTWWISGFGSMPLGKGKEFVEFELAKTVCRLSTFKIEIPPLPSGPLSVRTLRLDRKTPDGSWQQCSPIWNVLNRTGLQSFELDTPVDTRYCRVVCLSNQISQFFEGQVQDDVMTYEYMCVGYFTVRFE